MTSFRVLSWRGIPSQVEVVGEDGAVQKRRLPTFFQQEIDRVAMAEGLVDEDAYLEAWEWSEPEPYGGPADEVADAIVDEVARRWRGAVGRPVEESSS